MDTVLRWTRKAVGCFTASIFSVTYLVGPVYTFLCLYLLLSALFRLTWPSCNTLLFTSPFILTVVIPPIPAPNVVRSFFFQCLVDYFGYEEIFEVPDEELLKMMKKRKAEGKSLLLCAAPHGVLSYTALCAVAKSDMRFGGLCTAVAGVVLKTPFIKHIIGIYGAIDASSKSMSKHLSKGGAEGSLVLYTGGIAELFFCSESEETLYLKERKGFVKLALKTGADIIPLYFFGNTSVLSVLNNSTLANFSRKYQVSITLFWGWFGLPIPRPNKLVYVRGKPLGLPHIENPSQDDIDKWHAAYIAEVQRIFDTYKKGLPLYKDKILHIE